MKKASSSQTESCVVIFYKCRLYWFDKIRPGIQGMEHHRSYEVKTPLFTGQTPSPTKYYRRIKDKMCRHRYSMKYITHYITCVGILGGSMLLHGVHRYS